MQATTDSAETAERIYLHPPVESENLAPQPVQAAQPTQAPESQNSEAKQTNGKKKSGKGKIIAIVIGVFLVISIIGAAAGGSSDSSSSASSSSQSSASSSANAEAEDTSSEKALLRSSLDANTGKDPSAYTEESFATLSAALENGEKSTLTKVPRSRRCKVQLEKSTTLYHLSKKPSIPTITSQ